MLRQACELREIAKVVWIPSKNNPADAMAKDQPSPAPRNWMCTNTLLIDVKSWVERMKSTSERCTELSKQEYGNPWGSWVSDYLPTYHV